MQSTQLYRSRSNQQHSNQPSLHIGNLPKDAFYDLDLYKVFTTKGYNLRKAKVVLDRKTSKSLGYGYLVFYTQEEAERCMQEMNNYVIQGHSIVLSLNQSNK